MLIIQQKQLVMIDVIYYRPQTHILQEFFWQIDDFTPELPRTHKFLLYWKNNIDAVINTVLIAQGSSDYRAVNLEKFFNG